MVLPRSLRVKLWHTVLSPGFVALHGRVELLIRARFGFEPLGFLVDPGAGLTTIPASFARKNRIPLPVTPVYLRMRTSGGTNRQQVYPAHIRVRIPAFAGREFVWPCLFVEPIDVAPSAEGQATGLLGLGGVLDDLRIIFDGSYALDAPYGCIVLEEVSAPRAF